MITSVLQLPARKFDGRIELNTGHSLSLGLVGWWYAGHLSRTNRWFDASLYGNHGALELQGTTPLSDAWRVDGQRGSVFRSGGSNDDSVGIKIPDDIITGVGDFTIAAWVRPGTSFPWGTGPVVANRSGASIDGAYYLGFNGSYNARWWIYNSGFQFDVVSAGTYNDDAWHYLVGVRNGQSGILYIDGQQIGSGSGTIKQIDPVGAYIAKDNRAGDWIKARVDSVTIHRRAFSASESFQVYHDTLDGSPGPMALPVGPRIWPAAAAPAGGGVSEIIGGGVGGGILGA